MTDAWSDLQDEADENRPPVARLPRYSLAEVADEDYQLRWMIKGYWTQGGFGQLAGPEKALKTYQAILIAVAVASGRPLFGQFDVVTPGPVVFFTGEGSRHLIERRIRHLGPLFGLTAAAVKALPITLIDKTAQVLSEEFQETFQDELARKPVLIILDPLYAYHGAAANAGNIHEVTPILTKMSEATVAADVSLIVANHFNKAGAKTLSLASITQAGGREWSHGWVLVAHRSEPNLDEQIFELEFIVGSREGFGGHYDLDVMLGPLDGETVRHVGTPEIEVRPHAGKTGVVNIEETIIVLLAVNRFTLTKTELKLRVKARSDAVGATIDALTRQNVIMTKDETRVRSDGRNYTVTVYGLRPPVVVPDSEAAEQTH